MTIYSGFVFIKKVIFHSYVAMSNYQRVYQLPRSRNESGASPADQEPMDRRDRDLDLSVACPGETRWTTYSLSILTLMCIV